MTVGNAENLEHALQRAVLTRTAVQYIEGSIGLERAQRRSDVAIDVNAADAIAGPLQRIGARFARTQRYFAFRRPSTHQDRDVLHCSQRSSSDPLDLPLQTRRRNGTFTRSRTVSPRISMSAAAGATEVDQKIAVELGHLRATDW